MKKLLQLCMMALMSFGMVMPGMISSAEASNIVLMPIVDKSGYEGIGEVYYDNAVDVINDQVKYTMIDNDAVSAAIDKYTVKNQLPDETALRSIAEAVDADLIVGIGLNKVVLEEDHSKSESKCNLLIQGNTVSYNRETGKFVNHKLHENEIYDPAMYSRQNYPLRKFSRMVQHEMRRALGIKGFKVEKQRLQKF